MKEKNSETGEIEVAGTLNPKEVSFLVQYALNSLVAKGVVFDLKMQSDEIRMVAPDGATLQ